MSKRIVGEKKVNSSRQRSLGVMNLVFRRTGTRRYAVEVRRENFPDLEMDPAPGFDSLIPHDLMHVVVEANLGLTNGIFGQLAMGGDAGSFRPVIDHHQSPRTSARLRRHQRSRGKPLLREGHADCLQSEHATYICRYEWLRRSGKFANDDLLMRSGGKSQSTNRLESLKAIDERTMESICQHLDELSSVWADLQVGESMSVKWPDLSVSKLRPSECRG